MNDIFFYIMGILLLALGRRLFWLFIGCVGFVAGLQMAQQYFGLNPTWMNWVLGAVFGLAGAFLAVFFQNIAIGIGGFAAGITITTHLMFMMGFAAVPLIIIFGGVIGAILLYTLFDWGLIVLSSIAGSTIIVQTVNWNSQAEMVLYGVLAVTGILFQASLLRRQDSIANKNN